MPTELTNLMENADTIVTWVIGLATLFGLVYFLLKKFRKA